ncbi:anti-sigma-D factor RsdA [Mycolicibacterium sp. 050158]|uniref:anti-sigma-D factor RsdA n=1 Tax=Mycolicibacterium sp. 050158 TaxID=3090602 RepID=UPI00299D0D30|nr:anti-sigma-D factor RsdA [Mycolicibacterium sp. 050158]MDX1888388.1 anti-sigma-D factor RsdA [Mycolicibacterium sp. 050158]
MPDGRWAAGGGDPSLNEIARADRFIEALAAKQPVYSTDREEAELAFLLSGWRDDVRDAPVTVPVSPSDAVQALQAGLSKNRGPRRLFTIVGSVAAAMLCIGGFGTAVYGAGPGDSLYGMRTAIFGQQEATRDDRVSLASAQLAQVQQLIDNGQWQEAQDKLVAVSTTVQDVGQVEQKQQLVEQWNALTYKVVEQNPAATLPPGEPLPALPSSPLTWLPVPVVDGTTTSTTSATSGTSDPSSSVTTSPSDSTAPSDTSSTAPSDGATPTSSAPSSSAPSSSPSSSSAATTSAPSSTTTTTAPTTTTTTNTTTTTPATTTTTTSTTVPTREPAAAPPSTSAVAPAPKATTPAAAPSSAAEVPSAPAATTPVERSAVAPTTTTTLVPVPGS